MFLLNFFVRGFRRVAHFIYKGKAFTNLRYRMPIRNKNEFILAHISRLVNEFVLNSTILFIF